MAAYAGIESKAEAAVKLSYAKDSAFVPKVPSGLHPRTGKPFAFFPYQCAGIEYALARPDTLIADPMGLGKSPMAIGIFNCDEQITQTLIICPASLKEHWRREFELWKTRPVTVSIAESTREDVVQDGFYKNGKPRYRKVLTPDYWPNTDVVIINYDVLHRFEDRIKERDWDYLVCDESHALKNAESRRTCFVLGGTYVKKEKIPGRKKPRKTHLKFKRIAARRRVFLTGTPIMNRPIEIWPVVHAFDPKGLGRDYRGFGERYCAGWDNPYLDAFDVTGASNEEELGQRLRATFMIRRNKAEVLPELPPIFRQIVTVDSPEIRRLVSKEDDIATMLRMFERDILGNEFERETIQGDQIVAAAANFDLSGFMTPDGNLDRGAMNLSYAASVLDLREPEIGVLFEELAQVRRDLGLAKVSAILPLVTDIIDQGEKILLFGYHTDVLLKFRDSLAKYEPALIYGGTPVKKRQPEVDRIQDDEKCRVGILQIDAGGVGYTITRCAYAGFAEEDWVPTKKLQAENRICRPGQTAQKLFSISWVANKSLDARMANSSWGKEEVINRVLDT